MKPVRLLGIDFGSKRVGLALTDPLGITIQPLKYLTYASQNDLLDKIKSIAQEKDVQEIVLGLPRSLDGSVGPKGIECEKFSEKLKAGLNLPVHLQDESFTSRDAEEILIRDLNLSRQKRKEVKDSLSACLILKFFLESR